MIKGGARVRLEGSLYIEVHCLGGPCVVKSEASWAPLLNIMTDTSENTTFPQLRDLVSDYLLPEVLQIIFELVFAVEFFGHVLYTGKVKGLYVFVCICLICCSCSSKNFPLSRQSWQKQHARPTKRFCELHTILDNILDNFDK